MKYRAIKYRAPHLALLLFAAACGCDKIATVLPKNVLSQGTQAPSSPPSGPVVALKEAVVVETEENKEERQLKNQALQLLASRSFDKLEQMAADLRAGKAEFADGTRKLTSFYTALACMIDGLPDSMWCERIAALRGWAEARPASVTARIALAETMCNYAWKGRGGNWAREVTAGQWTLFKARLAESRTNLFEAGKLSAKCPRWYSIAMRVALGEGWPRKIYEQVFTEAIQSDPTYLGPYFLKSYYLLPRWYGKEGEWEKFVETAADERGGEEGDIFYARVTWYMDGTRCMGNLFQESNLSWPRVKRGFELLEKRYPESLPVTSEFAKLSGLAGDRPTMRSLMRKLDGRVDESTWTSKSRFVEDREWAFKGLATTNIPAAVHASTGVHLKDGRTIAGRIQTRVGSTVYVKTEDGKQLEISANDLRE